MSEQRMTSREDRARGYANEIADFFGFEGDERLEWVTRIEREALKIPGAERVDWDELRRRAHEANMRREWGDLYDEYRRFVSEEAK